MTADTRERHSDARVVPAPNERERQVEFDPSARQPCLDGLRGVAIIMVIFFHSTVLASGPWLDSLLRDVFRNFGWCGVELFFVLSGFLITGLLLDAKGEPHYFRNFYARRVLRIFPLYYGYLAALFLIGPELHSAVPRITDVRGDQLWFWVYLNNFLTVAAGDWQHSQLLNHLWSLAIEEQFYLVWPFVVLFCSRRALVTICAALVVSSPLLRVGLMAAGFNGISIYVFTPVRFDALAMGGLLALAVRAPGGVSRLVGPARVAVVLAGAAILTLVGWQGGFGYALRLSATWGLSLLAVLFGAALVLALAAEPRSWTARLLRSGALRRFGRYSYAMYLVHQLVIALVWYVLANRIEERFLPSSALGLQLVVYAGTFAGCLLLGALSWNLYEKPFLWLKRYFPGPHSTPLPRPPLRPGRRIRVPG